jgi:hypothetical protein
VYGGQGAAPRCTGPRARHWAAWAAEEGVRARYGSEAKHRAGKGAGGSAGPLPKGCSMEGIVTAEVTGIVRADVGAGVSSLEPLHACALAREAWFGCARRRDGDRVLHRPVCLARACVDEDGHIQDGRLGLV